MFNVARPSLPRYDAPNGLNASFVSDPLVSSVYDDNLDPWSSTAPTFPEPASNEFSGIIGMFYHEMAEKDKLMAGSDSPPLKEMHRYRRSTLKLSALLTPSILVLSLSMHYNA